MLKAVTILAVICTIVGVPVAGLVWFASGMKAAPGLSTDDLTWGLPLPMLAIFLGSVSSALSLTSKPKRIAPALVSMAVIVISSLAIALLLLVYSSTHR